MSGDLRSIGSVDAGFSTRVVYASGSTANSSYRHSKTEVQDFNYTYKGGFFRSTENWTSEIYSDAPTDHEAFRNTPLDEKASMPARCPETLRAEFEAYFLLHEKAVVSGEFRDYTISTKGWDPFKHPVPKGPDGGLVICLDGRNSDPFARDAEQRAKDSDVEGELLKFVSLLRRPEPQVGPGHERASFQPEMAALH